MLEFWSIGVLENLGIPRMAGFHYSISPVLQYSIMSHLIKAGGVSPDPVLMRFYVGSCGSLEHSLFAEVFNNAGSERFDSVRLRDNIHV